MDKVALIKKLAFSLTIVSASFASLTTAKGVSPYLPLKLDPLFELQLERLASITQMPIMRKPYAIMPIVDYAEKIKVSHPKLYSRLQGYILRYKKQSAVTQYGIEFGFGDNNNQPLPDQRGIDNNNALKLNFQAFNQINENIILNSGGIYGSSKGLIPQNTFISMGYEYAQLDLGYREHWLSPFQESSALYSTNAKPSLNATLSNVTPITDFNVQYELSVGLLEEMDGIHFDGKTSKGKPGFLSMQLSIQPINGWTLAGNRTFMFAGGERSVGLSDVWQAIIDPVSSDNCGGDSDLTDCNKEFGDQIASVTSKFDFNLWNFPITVAVEYAGEDTKDFQAYQFGNIGKTASIFLPYITDNIAFYTEYSNFHSAWYVHHLYENSYRNDNNVIGHWWGDNKALKDTSGADVATARLDWELAEDKQLTTTFRYIKINRHNESSPLYQSGKMLTLDYQQAYTQGFIGFNVSFGKTTLGESFYRAAIRYQW